ncbi:MAG: aldehyde dehydrogenase family protein, partial [Castellaniella sp.]
MSTISLLIGGEHRQAADGKTFQRRNPLDGQVATTAPAATPEDARAAVQAAADAFGAWSQT